MATSEATHRSSFYPTMPHQDDQLFYDEQIQRYDADTIQNRYGDNWRTLASNVREVTQADGSIVKEYIIEDPAVLEQMQGSSRSMTTDNDEHEQGSSKNKFAQIKAKFEQNHSGNVMGSPTTSSSYNSGATTSRQSAGRQTDESHRRERRGSNEMISMHRANGSRTPTDLLHSSMDAQTAYRRTQSAGSDKSNRGSLRRLDSADEADEEVRRIHRQGEELRRHQQSLSPIPSFHETSEASRVQYEVIDENGNPRSIDGIQDLIKMPGVRVRQVPQPDGTMMKEYIIDDPQVLSKLRSQQSSPMASSFSRSQQESMTHNEAPPPPPRIPLRQPVLFRQDAASTASMPTSIQQIHVLEPQHRYEYITNTGRRIQFTVTNSDELRRQAITDADIRELANAINSRLPTLSTASQSATQAQFTLPKPWHPSIDLMQRTSSHQPSMGSNAQHMSNESSRTYQQTHNDVMRSASYGELYEGSHASADTQQLSYQPNPDWNPMRQHDRQASSQTRHQRYQADEPFQTSAQFLPQTPPTKPSSMHDTAPVFYQPSTSYPYQGQQQHGVRIVHDPAHDFNHQQTAGMVDGRTRI